MPSTNRMVPRSQIDHLDLEARIDLEARVTDAEVGHVDIDQLAARTYRFEGWRRLTVNRFMVDHLSPVAGKTVLDLGCGYSMSPLRFAHADAMVTACEVSPRAIAAVQEVARRQGVADRIRFHVGPAERLPFPDASFDLIHGASVLHHVEVDMAGAELARVLKPGGKGVFTDPFGHNPLLEFARDYLPYPGKAQEKGTDLPLTVPAIARFAQHFSSHHWQGLELFGMIGKPLRIRRTIVGRRIHDGLNALDALVLRQIPGIQKYCRYVGLVVVR